MPFPKPDLMLDINKGIRELLAAKNIKTEEQLTHVVADCCLQACNCCIQISRQAHLDDDMMKLVHGAKVGVK